MKKKSLLTLAIGCIMSLGVTSCGDDTHEVDQQLPDDDPTSAIVIDFWHCLGHDKEENLKNTIVKEFNETWAGKYQINLVKLAGDYNSLHDGLKTKLASGEIPALTMGYPDSFSEYMTNDIKYSQILRLDNFIKNEKFGYSETELNDFVKGYYDEGNNYQFDGVWSMPMYKSTEVMYYNASYFAGNNDLNVKKFADDATFKALNAKVDKKPNASDADLKALKDYCKANGGYTYEVPTKWNDWIALGRQMQADRATEKITSEFYPIGYDSDANLMISQMKQRKIPYTTAKGVGEGHFLFNNDDTKGLLTEITTLIEDKVFLTKNSLGGSKYTNNYFKELKTAMSVGSTGGSSYNVSSNFVVKLAPVPYSGNTPYYIQQGPSICFFDNEDPYIHKGAWLFYKALANPENNAALALENSYDPIRVSSYDTQEYKDWIALAGKGLQYDIPATTATLKDSYMVSEVFVGSGTARNEIGNTILQITNSGYSVEDALTAAYNACVAAA